MNPTRPRSVTIAHLFANLLTMLLPTLLLAQQDPCDQFLRASAQDPYGYRLRTDRCEGLYIREVSGMPLTLASLVESVEDYDLALGTNLLVEWPALGKGDIRL